jgi:hypothetical protein
MGQINNYFSDAGINSATFNPYTSYTDAQTENFFRTNPNVDIAAATKEYNADPAAVNRYITSLAAPYKDPTATERGSGTLGVIQNARSLGIDPTEFAASFQANNPDWGKAGTYWNKGTVANAYDVADKVLAFDPITDKVTPSDKEWVAFMDTNKITVGDIARLTGEPINKVQARYDAAKEKPVVKTTSTTTTGGTTGTTGTTGATSTSPSGYYGGPQTTGVTPDGRTIDLTAPGDIRTNADTSRTVTPNIPSRTDPFAGAGQVRDAWTAGGGSLGQTLKPTKNYTNTGRSAEAYRYLLGEGDYPTNTQTRPKYANTAGNTTQKYIWVDNLLVANPDYIDPAKVAEDKKVTDTPVDVQSDGGGYANGGDIFVGNPNSSFEPTVGQFAAGGQTQYNLGGYSDGGRLLRGPGDGVSDSIPATIGKGQPARLADGEFVIPARIVSEIGNGSTEAGARKLYAMMDRVQKARGKTVGKGKVAKNTRADKYLPK